MSEDEGTTPTAQGVPSEADAATGAANEDDAGIDDEETTANESPERDVADAPTDGERTSPTEMAGPETTDDVETVLERVAEHDDELASQVSAIVEQARDLADTVDHQRDELEDLGERVDAQGETIADLQTSLETAEEQLETREAELEELKQRLKRKQADFQNYKKRAKKRQKQIKDRATEDLVERLLGVRDNLKRALGEESGDADALRDGVEMTLREFDRVLEDENVSEVDPEPGSEVDPQRHEVMMRMDSAQPEGTIADVYTPGYEMGDKVIQAAQVTVSNGTLVDDTESETEAERDDEGAASDSSEPTEMDDESVDDTVDADTEAPEDDEDADSET
ncbi:nucleotide exchange factor GrpE [Natrarchaeobaculum sulfurireducens]|uniref:Protein GrpE n=1 Tax=Natrarchaeobaculum sulfurireducens TaxID=2044521 RepID=A0A346PRI9_9EURY|nr:nucleotide exchange factor GrpE [Natrarchaeobaculum sulfurireducens]AXR77884.1 Molecular chaperone GrpE (heat shock protein) [Natrarchaeobaculum sulfurireducens]AXR82134.1 Heat shock protein GrpE [Natrarchaeobaculum sulfurireducens]